MSVSEVTAVPATKAEARAMLREMREETILLVLPALFLAGLPLYTIAGALSDPGQALLPCFVLFPVGVAVWALRRLSYLAAAWALVAGCALVILLLARVWSAAICLLALPVGVAAVFVGLPAGALVAAAASLLLAYGPHRVVPAGGELRAVSTVEVWGTVGLLWLSLRPLLTTLQWSWASRQQSLKLLEEAREQRLQLKQALADLAEANVQLTRLNNLAQSLRQAAEEARRAKERFVANVSHELRTPLNMVIGFSETILQAPETYGGRIPPALLADLAVILRNSQHLSDLLDDVLDLSQIEAGQMALTKERVAISELVEAATVAVRPLYVSKGLYLESEVAPDLPPVFCDRTRIREVLLNLLSNAGRFTERGGVRVRARREGADVVVSVADTGPGIADTDRERLFRPFEQLDGSIRRRYGGTGLGLAISRSFVELHGGTMWVESELGRGTTFLFRLPIDPPAPLVGGPSQWLSPDWEYRQRERPTRLRAGPIPPRVVVLETGESLQRLLKRYLDGVEIAAATTFEGAIAALGEAPAVALVVNDVSVPEALRRFSSSTELPYGTPAIICSVPGEHEAAGALGVARYLVKPVTRAALLSALEGLPIDGETVLVVDDDPESARLFRRMLNSYGRGYRILTAGEGRQALQMLRDERPAVLLLDLVMPDMDGFQLLAEKNADPTIRDVPVIVISARDPVGSPVVTNAVAVTRPGGLAMPQLLACIEAISGASAAAGPPAGPARTAELPG